MTETYRVQDIAGGKLTPEMQATMNFATDKGEVALDMDYEALSKTLHLAIKLQRVPAPEAGKNMDIRAFPVAWWTLGRTPDSAEVVMSFEIEGDGHIGFRIPKEQARRLHTVLGDTLAKMG